VPVRLSNGASGSRYTRCRYTLRRRSPLGRTSRSTVFAFTTLIGAPTSPPATCSSSSARHFSARGKGHTRRRAGGHCGGQLLAARLHFLPVGIDPAAGNSSDGFIPSRRGAFTCPRGRFAHVLHAGVGILGDVRERVVNGAMSQPGVEWEWEAVETHSGLVEIEPWITTSWQGASSDDRGGIGFAIARFQVSLMPSSAPAHADAVDLPARRERATTTGMSYLHPLASVTWVNRNAFLSGSSIPPRNCQRTRGCISVSLLIGPVDRDEQPGALEPCRCSWRSG